MRKLLLILLVLLIAFPNIGFAAKRGIYTTVATGSVTRANMRLSGVDGGATASGGAFVDFGAANVLTTKIGHLLRIKDSAGKQIQGFIKAAGTGETAVTDVVVGWDFTSGWGTSASASIIDSNTFATTNDNKYIYKVSYLTASALYKATYSGTVSSGTSGIYDGGLVATLFCALGTTTYFTNISGSGNTAVMLKNSTSATTDVSALTIYRVTAPSATGVTITSTKGGATYNWTNKNSAFNWNDTAGYTYEIVKVNNTVLMDSDTCTNANATLVQTDGSASWACAGIDDSAYQDGKHIIHISDSAGRVIFGYYKSGGSGAVVNAHSGSTQNFIYKNPSFATDGNYTRKIYYVGD